MISIALIWYVDTLITLVMLTTSPGIGLTNHAPMVDVSCVLCPLEVVDPLRSSCAVANRKINCNIKLPHIENLHFALLEIDESGPAKGLRM
jgi:hypothetical protein